MHAMSVRCSQRPDESPLELQLQAVVSHLMWVLETEIRFSGRNVYFLKCHLLSFCKYIPTKIKVDMRPLSMGLNLVAILSLDL